MSRYRHDRSAVVRLACFMKHAREHTHAHKNKPARERAGLPKTKTNWLLLFRQTESFPVRLGDELGQVTAIRRLGT